MGDLDAHGYAERMIQPSDAAQALDVSVLPDAETSRRDARIGGDAAHFDKSATDAAEREARVMIDMPVVDVSVLGAVLAHGRNDDSIAEGDVTHLQRLEKRRRGHCIHLASSSFISVSSLSMCSRSFFTR